MTQIITTLILIGATVLAATAMTKTDAAVLIGDYIVSAQGGTMLAGTLLVSAVITQFIHNTSSMLAMMPIGLATASKLSALLLMLGVAMGASACFLTPFANGVSLMVHRLGRYRFSSSWPGR